MASEWDQILARPSRAHLELDTGFRSSEGVVLSRIIPTPVQYGVRPNIEGRRGMPRRWVLVWDPVRVGFYQALRRHYLAHAQGEPVEFLLPGPDPETIVALYDGPPTYRGDARFGAVQVPVRESFVTPT